MFALFYKGTMLAQHPTKDAVVAEAFSLNYSVSLNRMVVCRSARTGIVSLSHGFEIKELFDG